MKGDTTPHATLVVSQSKTATLTHNNKQQGSVSLIRNAPQITDLLRHTSTTTVLKSDVAQQEVPQSFEMS